MLISFLLKYANRYGITSYNIQKDTQLLDGGLNVAVK